MLKKSFMFTMGLGAVLAGCNSEQPLSPAEATQEITNNLLQAGFPADDIMTVDGVVYVGRDAAVSLEASREMLETESGDSNEQYRTRNTVSRSLAEICVNGSAYTGSFSTALNNAISNYNNLGLTFRLRRTTSSAGCSATIVARLDNSGGGVAGFPSGGLPFGSITLGRSLGTLSVGTITHVVTHELGHTVGLRHSDYFNRSISCGTGGNEGDAALARSSFRARRPAPAWVARS